MSEKNMITAESYYKAMGNKDLEGMAQYLHPDVQFIGPMAKMTGTVIMAGIIGIVLNVMWRQQGGVMGVIIFWVFYFFIPSFPVILKPS